MRQTSWVTLSGSCEVLEKFVLHIMEISIGVMIGVIATLVTLLLFHWIIAPKVSFSTDIRAVWLKISKRPSYSIKMRKHGVVDLIDTQIRCTLFVRDVEKKGATLWNFYRIPTSHSDSLIAPNGTRIIHLNLNDANVANIDNFTYFKRHLKIGRPDVGVRFEDFFMSYNEVFIRVDVLGHDRVTGVKKLYMSEKYRFFTLRTGQWKGMETT